MTAWDDARKQELRLRWDRGESMGAIASAMGTTRSAISGASNRLNLQFHGGKPTVIALGSAPDVNATTRFLSRVQQPGRNGVLKPGSYQRKLGPIVLKGPWKGMPIFSLSLEERATCPRTCKQWLSCYGNASGMSVRYAHGPLLLDAITADLRSLQAAHPRGFVVRTHQLGDFFSVAYVEFWQRALDRFTALHVFGYTARLPGDPIGDAVTALRDKRWDRFAIRTSDGKVGPRTLVVNDKAGASAANAIICPAQTGGTSCCSSCGLCWAPAARERPIAFLAH